LLLFNKKRNKIFRIVLCFFLVLIIFQGALLSGCSRISSPPPVKAPGENSGEETLPESMNEKETKELTSVALYFSDEDTAYLVKEERDISDTEKDPEVFALEALIEGPTNSALERTIPADVKLLDISVVDGIALVDFSEELQSSHWGGSTGEILTVYSIVNTLSQFPQIEQVKILINGEEVETLAGHMELNKPLEPDFGLVKQ